MGRELMAAGLHPDHCKEAAIQQMSVSTDPPGVLRLLGMATYLAKFCANFGEITAPICQLLMKNVDFRGNDAPHGVALQRLKVMLTNAPVLSYYVTKSILV